jgi:hypothetical protein
MEVKSMACADFAPSNWGAIFESVGLSLPLEKLGALRMARLE